MTQAPEREGVQAPADDTTSPDPQARVDAWLADLAVGSRVGQIKVGPTMRSERTANGIACSGSRQSLATPSLSRDGRRSRSASEAAD